MPVPILRQDDVFIASIPRPLSDAELLDLRDALIERVSESPARSVIVDVTALDVVDSFASRTLRELVSMIRLLEARIVIVGISPHVAFAMDHLGITLGDIPTAADLEEGLAYLDSPSR